MVENSACQQCLGDVYNVLEQGLPILSSCGHLSTTNINLHSLVHQSGLSQAPVPLSPPLNEIFFRRAILRMLVALPLVLDRDEWQRVPGARLIGRRVIMTSVQPGLRRQRKNASNGPPQNASIAAGEVAARGTDVRVEQAISGENTPFDMIAHMVRGVAGQMHDCGGDLSDLELFAVVVEVVEGALQLGFGDVVFVREGVLHRDDVLANTDRGVWATGHPQGLLEIVRRREVIRMRVRLQEGRDCVALFADEIQDLVGGLRADGEC